MKKSYFKKSISIFISIILAGNLFVFNIAFAANDDYHSVSSDILTDDEIEAITALVLEHDEGKDYVTFEEYSEEKEAAEVAEYKEKYEFQTARLIVRSEKAIDWFGAEDCAMFDESTYILQYSNPKLAEDAYNNYNSLDYVEFVEADSVFETCKISGQFQNINYNPDNSDFDTYDINNYMEKPYPNTKVTEAKQYMLDNKTACANEVRVAIVDTGVDMNHEAIKGRFAGGYDFVKGGKNQGGIDDFGHGTAVAGVIVDETTPNVKIVSYKVGDKDRELSTSLITLAMKRAITENIDVINMSFGSLSSSNFLASIIQEAHDKNILMISVAGNDGLDIDKNRYYPACDRHVIAVGAVGAANYIANYSNYGSDVMVYAFGYPITACSCNVNTTNKYIKVSGTSFACPVISAEAAMIRAMYPNESADEIMGRICQGTEKPVLDIRAEKGEQTNLNNAYLVNFFNSLAMETPTDVYSAIPEILIDRISWDAYKITFKSTDEKAKYTYNITTDSSSYTEMQSGDSFICTYDSRLDKSLRRYIEVYAQSEKKLRSDCKTDMFIFGYSNNGFYCDDNGVIKCYEPYEYDGDPMNPVVPEMIETVIPTAIERRGKYFTGKEKYEFESITCPESIKKIGGLNSLKSLKSVVAPGVVSIENSAFYNCPNLSYVEFGDVVELGFCAFLECVSLKDFSCNFLVESVPYECFENCGIESVYMPNCKYIGSMAFADCENLKKADFPVCRETDNRVFLNCHNLEYVNMPCVEKLGLRAFSNTTNLERVNLNAWHEFTYSNEIDDEYFYNSGIKSITLYLNKPCGFWCASLDYMYFPEAISYSAYDICALQIKRIEFEKLQELNGIENGVEIISVPSSTVSISIPENDDWGIPNENLIVYGTEGTEISIFCKENNIEFRNISQETALMTDLPMEYTNADEPLVADVIGFNRTYQWYGNTTADNMTGTAIDGATDKEFNPTDYEVYPYYYCVVTSTDVGYDPVEIRTGVTMNKTVSADYSALNEIVASVPSDLSVYTEESVAELQTVLDAIVYDLPISEQSVIDEQAMTILDAINNLEYKPADYTEYNKAVEKANNIDRSLYKDLSALDKAISVDVSGKNITEQDIVDTQTQAIVDAVNGLEKKPVETPTEPVEDPTDTEDEPIEPSESVIEPTTSPSDNVSDKPNIPDTNTNIEMVKNPNTGGKNLTLLVSFSLLFSTALIAVINKRKRENKI